jgi:hypothetical protein
MNEGIRITGKIRHENQGLKTKLSDCIVLHGGALHAKHLREPGIGTQRIRVSTTSQNAR